MVRHDLLYLFQLRPLIMHLRNPVTLGGAVLFLIFGLVYAREAWLWDEVAELAASAEIMAGLARRR